MASILSITVLNVLLMVLWITSSMAFLLIPVILLAVVWLSYIRRRLSELNENVNTAMNQIGLQLSSRFRALEALLELARTHGLSAQLVLLPPSINALSTPAQVLEHNLHFLARHCHPSQMYVHSSLESFWSPFLCILHAYSFLLFRRPLYRLTAW